MPIRFLRILVVFLALGLAAPHAAAFAGHIYTTQFTYTTVVCP